FIYLLLRISSWYHSLIPAILSIPTRRSSDLSRIATDPNLIISSPVTQLTAEEFSYRGITRVEDLINDLPQITPELTANESNGARSEEHTSELQSREKLVCRLLLVKKKLIIQG